MAEPRHTTDVEVTLSEIENRAMRIVKEQREDDLEERFRILEMETLHLDSDRRTVRVVLDAPEVLTGSEAEELLLEEIRKVLDQEVPPLG
jgi:hypothetical protein